MTVIVWLDSADVTGAVNMYCAAPSFDEPLDLSPVVPRWVYVLPAASVTLTLGAAPLAPLLSAATSTASMVPAAAVTPVTSASPLLSLPVYVAETLSAMIVYSDQAAMSPDKTQVLVSSFHRRTTP